MEPEINQDPRNIRSSLLKRSTELALALQKIFPFEKIEVGDISWKLKHIHSTIPRCVEATCPTIISETLDEINKLNRSITFNSIPSISYIVPIYKCNPVLTQATIRSLGSQIGVNLEAIFVLDGNNPLDRKSLEEALQAAPSRARVKIISKKKNSGVARARNTGMKHIESEFFSWLDANDTIHPLRSLLSILKIINSNTLRLNTSYARINYLNDKLIIRNKQIINQGHTSFVAKKEILNLYGYLQPLKYHEDTEYERRLRFFKAPMGWCSTIGHFLDLDITKSRCEHLSSDTWADIEEISNHSFLQATLTSKATAERRVWNIKNEKLYTKILSDALNSHFPCNE